MMHIFSLVFSSRESIWGDLRLQLSIPFRQKSTFSNTKSLFKNDSHLDLQKKEKKSKPFHKIYFILIHNLIGYEDCLS